jgi:hypothetical protein
MWRILGEGPEDSFDLAVPGAVTHLGFLQRGAVLPGIAEVRVAAVGEQPPDAGLGRLGILPGMSVERADPTAGGPAPGIADWGEDAGSARSEHDGRVAVGRYVGRTIEPQNRSPAAGDDLDHRMRSRLPREQA